MSMLRRHHQARAIGTTGGDAGDAEQAATFDLFTVQQLKDAIDRHNRATPDAEDLSKSGNKGDLIARLTGAVELAPENPDGSTPPPADDNGGIPAGSVDGSTEFVPSAGPGHEAGGDYHADDPTYDAGDIGSTPDTRIGANEPAGGTVDPEQTPAQMTAQPAPEGQPDAPADLDEATSGVTTSADVTVPAKAARPAKSTQRKG